MKRTKVIALLLGALGIGLAPVASFAFTTPTPTPTPTPTKSVANVSDWCSHFFWTFTNATPQTITNVYVAHQTKSGDDNNDHTIASIAPGQTVGPFWGDWHSSYEDTWVLRYINPLRGIAPGAGFNAMLFGNTNHYETWKSCGIESSDLNGAAVARFVLVSSPYATNNEVGSATINPPVSSACEGDVDTTS